VPGVNGGATYNSSTGLYDTYSAVDITYTMERRTEVHATNLTAVAPTIAHSTVVTPSWFANKLINNPGSGGTGITLVSQSFAGDEEARGAFIDFPFSTMPEALILATGNTDNILGTSSTSDNLDGTTVPSYFTDVFSGSFHDCQIMEVEFTVGAGMNELFVDASMASEEYPTYVGTKFNDGFGVFLEGPNPLGGTYDNVNIGVSDTGETMTISGGLFVSGKVLNKVNNVSFNGYSPVTTYTARVVPGQTYTIKFVVADKVDSVIDSMAMMANLYAIRSWFYVRSTIKSGTGLSPTVATVEQDVLVEGTNVSATVGNKVSLAKGLYYVDSVGYSYDISKRKFTSSVIATDSPLVI
jgi:hypothetical protein